MEIQTETKTLVADFFGQEVVEMPKFVEAPTWAEDAHIGFSPIQNALMTAEQINKIAKAMIATSFGVPPYFLVASPTCMASRGWITSRFAVEPPNGKTWRFPL